MSKTRVVLLDVYHTQVGVFRKDADRLKFLATKGITADANDHSSFGSAHMDCDEGGTAYFSMVIPRSATKATWAHECVHIADFLMHRLGIPLGVENTEVRAYIVGHLFAEIEGLRG